MKKRTRRPTRNVTLSEWQLHLDGFKDWLAKQPLQIQRDIVTYAIRRHAFKRWELTADVPLSKAIQLPGVTLRLGAKIQLLLLLGKKLAFLSSDTRIMYPRYFTGQQAAELFGISERELRSRQNAEPYNTLRAGPHWNPEPCIDFVIKLLADRDAEGLKKAYATCVTISRACDIVGLGRINRPVAGNPVP